MKKLSFLDEYVDDKVKDTFIKFAQDDEILKQVIHRSKNLSEFLNSIMCSAICVISREQEITHRLTEILKNDPKVQDSLKQMADTISQETKDEKCITCRD